MDPQFTYVDPDRLYDHLVATLLLPPGERRERTEPLKEGHLLTLLYEHDGRELFHVTGSAHRGHARVEGVSFMTAQAFRAIPKLGTI